jgi:membrane-bound lytic murein transglycosylase F
LFHKKPAIIFKNKNFFSFIALLILIFCALIPVVAGCRFSRTPTTLDGIISKGEITVITRNTPHCYYLYSGHPIGFEYDLAKAFADFLGVKLKVKIVKNESELIPTLKAGKGAFIAACMPLSPKNKKNALFSDGYMEIRQHIIIHRDNQSIHWAEDLSDKVVHVRRNSSYHLQLEKLKKQGLNLSIIPHDDLPTEELIRRVADREIEATIANNNTAMLNRLYYPQAFIAGPITEKKNVAWAINPGSKKLLEVMNSFFGAIKENGTFSEIYDRYYAKAGAFSYDGLNHYHTAIRTKLPKYSGIIKRAANKHGIDWVLIAAQMYQESKFNPRARSHAGAYGLMQLIRPTAKSLGVKNILNPEENINAGVAHLKNLNVFFKKADGSDRLFISLAAYNVGQGHILDAQNIARKKGLDPNKWSSLAKTLPLLSQEKYYSKSRYGYCRGIEPVNYIKQIIIYYDILKRKIKGYSASSAQPKKPVV